MKKVYLAGPEVFCKDPIQYGVKLKEFCLAHGLTGLYPLDNEVNNFKNDRDTAMRIFAGNINLMQEADCAVANIVPFRSPNMDPGTALEIGYMHALKKPVFVYTNDGRTLSDRTNNSSSTFPRIESFGLIENLMIIGAAYAVYATAEDAILAATRFFNIG